MRIQNLLALSTITIFGNASEAKAPLPVTPIIKRSFTLTPGYMERTFNSNDMMKYGPLSLMQLSSKCVDEVATIDKDIWAKIGIFAAFSVPHFFLAATSHTIYHEFGHARAIAALGGSYSYYAASQGKLPTDYAYGIYLERIKEPSAFGEGAATSFRTNLNQLRKIPTSFIKRITSHSSHISTKLNAWWENPHAVATADLTSNEQYVLDLFKIQKKHPLASSFPRGRPFISEAVVEKAKSNISTGHLYVPEQDNVEELQKFSIYLMLQDDCFIVVDLAGINNQMRYAQEVADLIFKNNGHQLYFWDYMMGKSEGYRYTAIYKNHLAANKVSPGNDIYCILHDYTNRGLNINASDIQMGSLASLFLSSTTWTFVYSVCTELPKGSFLVHAPVWRGWRLPDLNFYMTTQGLSFQVVTGFQFNENWYAGLTVEKVYKGNTEYEFGPSIGYSFTTPSGKFDLAAQVIIGQDMELGGNAGIEWTSPCKDWTVGLKYTCHNALTLVGERNIPFLCSGFMADGEPSHINHEINMTLSYNY